MKRKFLSFIVLMAMFATYSGFLSFGNYGAVDTANAATTSSVQTITLYVTSTITLTLTTSTLALGTLTPGTPITGDTSLSVTTNEWTGWTLQVKRDDAASTLDLVADGSYDFPDATDWDYSAPNATTSPEVGANLSFRVNTGTDVDLFDAALWGTDDGSDAWFAGFPATDQTIATRTDYASGAQTVAYTVRADAPSTQASGAYDGTVTFTALTNL